MVTDRLLPRLLSLDASDKFCVTDEVVEEFVPDFGGHAGSGIANLLTPMDDFSLSK